MNNEILRDNTIESAIVSAASNPTPGRALRVHDRLGPDVDACAAASPEESLVVDERCDVSPAQMVESKLTRVLGGAMLPVSHLQMRGLLRER
jgi:hypothetical protein